VFGFHFIRQYEQGIVFRRGKIGEKVRQAQPALMANGARVA
jgi:hypothetical protein